MTRTVHDIGGGHVAGGRREPAEEGGARADVEAVRRAYLEAIVRGARDEAAHLVLCALADGLEVRDVYLRVLQPAQRDLGGG